MVARVGTTAGRQRVIVEHGFVLLILHDLPDPLAPGARSAKLFCRRPDGSWHSTGTSDRTLSPLEAHVAAFHAALDRLEERVEGHNDADAWFEILRDLTPLARSTRNMARAIEELRQAVGPDKKLIAIRDRASDLDRTGELIREWANQGLEHSLAKSNEEQAKLSTFLSHSSHRLNMIAAMTLPLTAVGSFFGVNLASGMERMGAPYTFWVVGLSSLLLGFMLRASMPVPPADTPLARPLNRKS